MVYIIVGIGGIFGSITRYQLGKLMAAKFPYVFPIGTFVINISGALLLGIVSSMKLSANTYILFGDDFLGAYTTFSTFMYEGSTLIRGNKELTAAAYITLSVSLGVAAYILGALIGRILC